MNFSENESSAGNQQERVINPIRDEGLKYYLAGFTDGEGSFSVSICKHPKARFRWKIDPHFQVYQHKDNARVLYLFPKVLACGYISKKGGNPSCYMYCVDNLRDLKTLVIPFFEKYPLLGEKYRNFRLFSLIVDGLLQGTHKTPEGFIQLAKIAFQMNRNGKYRKNKLTDIIKDLRLSSETTRQTLLTNEGMI